MRWRANLRALTLHVPEKVSRSRIHHRPLPRVCTEEAQGGGCCQADREDPVVCCASLVVHTFCDTVPLDDFQTW